MGWNNLFPCKNGVKAAIPLKKEPRSLPAYRRQALAIIELKARKAAKTQRACQRQLLREPKKSVLRFNNPMIQERTSESILVESRMFADGFSISNTSFLKVESWS